MTNYTTVEQLMEKVQWMLPSFATFNIDEMVTHVYDAMRIIGGLKNNIKDNITLTVEDNRCKIPSEIEDILTIHYNNKILGTFPLTKVDNIDAGMSYVYMLYNGYIYTDIVEGDIFVDVSILPLDSNGRPLIPNQMYYEKAVIAYMFERIMFKLYIQDLINENKYERCRQDWIYYCGTAKSASLLLRRDEENAFNASTLSVFPKLKRFLTSSGTEKKNIPSVPFNDLNQLLFTQAIDPTTTSFNNTPANNGSSS